MAAQQKRERPEITGDPHKNRPEIPANTPHRPETAGKGRPGAMPENPANIDREHEPAGIDPGTDRTQENGQKRGRS